MEDREGPATLTPPPAITTVVPAAAPRPIIGSGWVVSPVYDLLFLANVGWPLLLLPGLSSRSETVVDFWQVYFLTLPHRWITLVLVAVDPDRRRGRGVLFVGLPIAAALLVVGVWYGTAALTCLAAVDYVWNGWHFAAQHAGILRIYARKVGGGWAALERHGLRLFIMYTVLRTATWTTGWLDTTSPSGLPLRVADLAILSVPAVLLISVLPGLRPSRAARTVYLASVCGLYAGLLLSLSFRWAAGVIALTTASGMFHAVEYLAVVTHYAQRRTEVGSDGAFRRLACVWLPFLAVYAAVIGSAGVWLDERSSPAREFWQGLNLWAAFVHYAFDGLIWKLRSPETARTLGAEAVGSAA